MTALQVPARHLLAKLYFLNGQYDKAIVELERALQLDPMDFGVAYTLAPAYLKQQPGKAKQVFERILGSLGDSFQFRVSMGRAYQETGIWEQALEQFRRAVQLNPRHPFAHYYLGLTYLLQQQIPEGIKALREELALNPDHYFAHLYLGFTYALKDNAAQVIQSLSRTIDLLTYTRRTVVTPIWAGADTSHTNTPNARADLIPGCNPSLNKPTAAQMYNRGCFTRPAEGRFGNAGRNSVWGPANLGHSGNFLSPNFGLYKYTTISPRARWAENGLRLRVGFKLIKALNHPTDLPLRRRQISVH